MSGFYSIVELFYLSFILSEAIYCLKYFQYQPRSRPHKDNSRQVTIHSSFEGISNSLAIQKLKWIRASLLSGRPLVQTMAGPTLGVFT